MAASRKQQIVFLDQSTLPIALPAFSFPHEIVVYDLTSAEQVAERIAQADIVLSNKVAIAAEHIAAAPNLRIIGVPAVGLDHIDQAACAARNISVFNASGYASEGVAEHALMMMLVLRRKLAEYATAARDGTWSNSTLFCHFGSRFDDLSGQTLGLIGGGGIGQSLARIAQGLGMQVLYSERRHATNVRAGYTAFDTVLQQADVISLSIPLNPKTAEIINSDTLAMMKPTSILINTGRGGLVNEAALLDALHNQTIGAAGLDVLSVEPPPADHPLLRYTGDNLLITPHSAWIGTATLSRLVHILHNKIEGEN